jgi:hypothetical protein
MRLYSAPGYAGNKQKSYVTTTQAGLHIAVFSYVWVPCFWSFAHKLDYWLFGILLLITFLLGLGMNKRCGDIDFFPNGGEFQPGCNQSLFKIADSIARLKVEGTSMHYDDIPLSFLLVFFLHVCKGLRGQVVRTVVSQYEISHFRSASVRFLLGVLLTTGRRSPKMHCIIYIS